MDITYKKIEHTDPKEEKQSIWDMAVGLNKVDNLEQSEQFYKLASEQVEGKKTYQEVESAIKKYYNSIPKNNEQEEADLVAVRMAQFLSSPGGIKLTPAYFKSIHGFIFKDIWKGRNALFIGNFRTYDITKSERVLNGDTVHYMSYFQLEEALKHDFEYENKKNYKNFTSEEIIENIAQFTANIWQIHPFIEGNTRTTALFIEKYLKKKKIFIQKDVFKDNSQYFRDALVMANCDTEDYFFLKNFFRKAIYEPEIILEEIPPLEEDNGISPR